MRLLLLFTLFVLSAFAYSGELFTKNIGQVRNELGTRNNEVLYIFNGSELTVTLRNDGFSYEVKNITNATSELKNISKNYKFDATIERIDFEFPKEPSQIIHQYKDKAYINIYSDLGSFERIPQYKKIIYKEVSVGIDIEFIIENGKFKYNVIAEPKADLMEFFIQVNSEKTPTLSEKMLILKTSNGVLKETIPISYFEKSKEEVKVYYKLNGRKIYFETTEQIRKENLIIDPVPDLIWNTYFGGSQYDAVNDVAVTKDNEVFQTGFTMSLDNISTSGAFLENYQGDLDAFVSKFDINGNIIWSTYYAGSQTERVYNIDVDTLGNCFIAGSSFSTTGIATAGAHQEYVDGADDIFILKLSSNGQRDWCTYHGGNGHDFVTDIDIYNDTIFLVGHTTSTNNMTTPGVHMEVNTTSEAGHVTLFSINGDFLWGSYFGNDGNNSAEGVAVNDNSIFITGRTNSATGISTIGAHQESLTGFVDGFVSKFDKTGAQIWGTYYGGDYTDKSKDIVLDENGNIYICGDATSTNQISTPGVHQENRLSAEQGFISKFSGGGEIIWGSYTGGYNTDYVHKISYKDGYLYLGGQTLSESEIATSDGFQTIKADGYDVFIQKFDTTGLFVWGSYFGDVANEDLSSVMLTKNQQILLSGSTNVSSVNFSTVNAHQVNFGGGSLDGFLTYLCQPIKPAISYVDGLLSSSTADEYDWYYEGNSLNLYSQSISPSNAGQYYVVTSNSGLCKDTSDVFNFSTTGLTNENNSSIKIYPNPASDYIIIEGVDIAEVEVLDVNSKILLSTPVNDEIKLSLHKLSGGIYIVKIKTNSLITKRKIIKI